MSSWSPGSPAALPSRGLPAFSRPIFWVANAALSTVLSWSSTYNEALCALFLLSALVLFMRFAETGRWVYWWWQLVVFVLGFGALEVNVVYPAIAAAYALCIAWKTRRRLLLSLTPLFAVSVAYFLLHRAVAPLPVAGPYAIHLDGRIFRTLAIYWKWSVTPQNWPAQALIHRLALFWIATAALAAFFVRELTKRRWLVLFFGLWFLVTLAPMLPLPEHTSDYYLTIPLIGLAMIGAWGVACAWRSQWPWRVAALLLTAAWLQAMVAGSLADSHWWLDRSSEVRAMVLGAEAAHRAHPEQTIVLDAVTNALYDDAIADKAFYALGLDYVYLTPGSGDKIHASRDPELLSQVVLDPAVMKNAITHDEVVVYSVIGDHLRNITEPYERSAFERFSSSREPHRIEVGNPLLAYLLGPEWFQLESGVRWMPRRATVRLGGPESAKDKLLLEGDCPKTRLQAGAVHLSVSVDGIPLAGTEIGGAESRFRRLFVVPPSLVGRRSVEVAISVDRVLHEPGGRDLGLVFGTIAFERDPAAR